jgi:hypothetical protein
MEMKMDFRPTLILSGLILLGFCGYQIYTIEEYLRYIWYVYAGCILGVLTLLIWIEGK